MQPKVSPEPEKLIPKPATEPKFDKQVIGSTIRCLEDPSFSSDTKTQLPSQQQQQQPPPASRLAVATSEVVEEARDRFDRYWSKPADSGNTK